VFRARKGRSLANHTVVRLSALAAAICALALPSRAAHAPAQSYGEPRLLASLADKQVTESSGLAASRRSPGVLWTHNDSGGQPTLYATDLKGRALGAYTVPGATAEDWEDIACVGTGDDAALYVGEFGDQTKGLAVYRVWEPAVDPAKTNQKGRTMLAEKYPFAYPDGRHDAETLLAHPATGEIFVVTKKEAGASGVYRFPMPLSRNRTVTLERVATVRFSNPLALRGRNVGRLATGGDISPDGRRVAIRTYTDGFEWTIPASGSLAEAFAGKPRTVGLPWLGQYESLCYSLDGRSLLTTAEGSPCPLWELRAK
jgi:hypothetical protein